MNVRARLKLGENEIEIEGPPKYVDAKLTQFQARMQPSEAAAPSRDLPSQIVASSKAGKAQAPAEYVRQKSPQGGTETLIVLGKYLEDVRSTQEFSREQVNKLAAEAKLKDVHGEYFRMAVRQGLMRSVGSGKYALTLSGEDAVLGMPARPKDKST